jgi:hypothetical protein
MVSCWEVVGELACELERVKTSRPRQELFDKAIWVTE